MHEQQKAFLVEAIEAYTVYAQLIEVVTNGGQEPQLTFYYDLSGNVTELHNDDILYFGFTNPLELLIKSLMNTVRCGAKTPMLQYHEMKNHLTLEDGDEVEWVDFLKAVNDLHNEHAITWREAVEKALVEANWQLGADKYVFSLAG